MSIRGERLSKLAAMQMNILRRFMNEKEIEELVKKYKENSHSGTGAGYRFSQMEKPLTIAEKELLREYFFEEDMSISEISESRGWVTGKEGQPNVGKAHQQVGFSLAKLVFQNQDKLNLKELLGQVEGGEKNEV